MRAVIQRVVSASVTINEELLSQIGPGICLFVGFNATDNASDMDYIINKTNRLLEDYNNGTLVVERLEGEQELDYPILYNRKK